MPLSSLSPDQILVRLHEEVNLDPAEERVAGLVLAAESPSDNNEEYQRLSATISGIARECVRGNLFEMLRLKTINGRR